MEADRKASRWRVTIATLFAFVVLYVLSYAPFLRFAVGDGREIVGYRAPVIYRPVEWIMLDTPLRKPLFAWADLCGAHSRCEIQVWFYAQGTSDPDEWHFNFPDDGT
jgi:hypothetical protein